MIRNLWFLAALLHMLMAAVALAEGVVIYTSNSALAVVEVQKAIRQDLGHEVSFVTGGSAVLLNLIESEGAQSRADLMWSSSISTLGAFPGLFSPYEAPALADIHPHLHDPDNLFLPASIHVITLMVNSDQLEGRPVPTSWKALTDPIWRGRVIVADPANSSTSYAALYGLSKLMDRADYEALVANLVIAEASSIVPMAVAAGDYPIGLTFEASSYFYIDAGLDQFNVIYPSDGTFITADYVAMVKTAASPQVARRTLDMLLSRETQIALLKNAYRRPSRMDIRISDHVNLPELEDIHVFAFDEVQAAADRPRFLADWASLSKAGLADYAVPECKL